MDYSNLRKIIIIFCILSVLLSISKSVFASDYTTNNTYNVKSYNQDINLPESFKQNYWFCYISNNTSGFNGFMLKIIYSDTKFNANLSNGSYICSSLNNAKIRNYQVSGPSRTLAQIQTYIDGLTFDLSNVTATNYTNLNILPSNYNKGGILASNFNITNDNDEIVINQTNSNIIKPYFQNPTSDFENLTFNNLLVSPGTYELTTNIYLKILEVTDVIEDTNDPTNNIYYYNDLTFTLNNRSSFLKEFSDTGTYYYSIPNNALKLKKDKSYYFILTNNITQIQNSFGILTTSESIFDLKLVDTAGIITTQDEIANSLSNNNPSDNTNNIIGNNLPRPGFSDGSNINIPGMNVDIPEDATSSSFNWIFNYIYNTLLTIQEGVPDIYFEFKPIGYNDSGRLFSFRISPYLVRDFLGADSPVIILIHSIYWFIISYYILNSIRKYIETIKSGDIMTHTDTNIKSEML